MLPFWSTAKRKETITMPTGLRFASHATMIAVKPTPPATDLERVCSVPHACTMPAIQQTEPLRTIVLMVIFPGFMPAYLAVAWLSETTIIS